MTLLPIALRHLRREWRSGDLRLLIASLIVAAAAISTVGFITSRVGQAMRTGANAALAADVDIQGPTRLPARYRTLAHDNDLQTTMLVRFPSVVFHADQSHLAAVHAIGPKYPLRGHVELRRAPGGALHRADAIPDPGVVWVAPRLLTELHVKVGETLRVGATTLKVGAVLGFAPGQGIDFIQFAPAIYINHADLASTHLIGPGSRVSYHLLAAGTSEAVANYISQLGNNKRQTDRIRTINDARSEVTAPLAQAQDFLSLAALIAVLVAAVGLALSARQYALRQTDTVAMLYSFGMTQRRLSVLLLVQLLTLGVTATLLGCLIGFGVQSALGQLLATALPNGLPSPGLGTIATTFATVVLLLLGFALAPLLQLRNTPPAHILRRDPTQHPSSRLVPWICAIVALLALLAWQVDNNRLTLTVFAALAGTMLVLAVCSGMMLALLRAVRGFGRAWRFGLGNLHRRRGQAIFQMTTFGLAISVLLALTLVRADIFSAWHNTLPLNAPNEFVFNIQPAQRNALRQVLQQNNMAAPRLYPMTRARLVGINGTRVSAADFEGKRARHLLDRQSNLSVAAFRRQANVITAGRWWNKNDYGKKWVSVSKNIADAFDVAPGDSLTFALAGQELTLKIVNLRNIRWQSFEPNFYFVVPPGVLNRYAKTFITALYVPPDKAAVPDTLARKLPGVAVINVRAIIHTIRTILRQASLAVGAVFVFTLLAGIVVLLATIQMTREERRFEAALLRALGASRQTIFKGLIAEFATVGLIAGGLGSTAALGTGWLLVEHVFKLPYHINPWIIPIGTAGGIVLITVTGLLATFATMSRSPMTALRN